MSAWQASLIGADGLCFLIDSLKTVAIGWSYNTLNRVSQKILFFFIHSTYGNIKYVFWNPCSAGPHMHRLLRIQGVPYSIFGQYKIKQMSGKNYGTPCIITLPPFQLSLIDDVQVEQGACISLWSLVTTMKCVHTNVSPTWYPHNIDTLWAHLTAKFKRFHPNSGIRFWNYDYVFLFYL